MATEIARIVAEAYRWQRRLGNTVIAAPRCHIIADPVPGGLELQPCRRGHGRGRMQPSTTFFAAIEHHLQHAPWRVIHTDGYTADACLARLALDGFDEHPVTIQMVLRGELAARGPGDRAVPGDVGGGL